MVNRFGGVTQTIRSWVTRSMRRIALLTKLLTYEKTFFFESECKITAFV